MKKLFFCVMCLLLSVVTASAQSFRAQGLVKDETGAPVIGASVIVKGTTTGVTTGVDGKFSLTVPNSGSVLEISLLGYDKVEATAKPEMTITLSSSSTMVEEVVVTGMTQLDKRLFTGASDRLTAEDVRIDGVADISRGLEGKSAGVTVSNVSGTFGTAPKITIRGVTSLLGNSKPLWVLDGVIIEDVAEINADQLSSGDAVTMISSAVAGLNADDIESFQILKDGSATSIYGARAMAGVIVIKTKRGQAGTTRLNYTGEFTTRLKPSYRNYNIMNSQDQMGIYKQLSEKGFLNFSETLRASNSGVYGKMYELYSDYDPISQFGLQVGSTEARNQYLREAEYRNTDWFDQLFNNSVMMNHSVSISSGTDKSASYLSMSAMNDPGWYKQSKVERYTLNANSQYKILDNLTFTILGNASYRNQKAPGTLSQEVDAASGQITREFDINPFSYALNTSRTLDPKEYYTRNYSPFNIFNELENNYINLNVIETKFQGELKWTIIPGLTAGVLAAATYKSTSQQHFIMDDSNQANAYRAMDDSVIRSSNSYLYTDPDNPNSLPIPVLDNGGFYNKREYRSLSYDFRADINWNKVFDATHIVSAYGGMEINDTRRMQDSFNGVGMQYSQGETPFVNYLFFKKMSEMGQDYYSLYNTHKKNASFFSTATYSYMGKYSLTGTFRYEGTNRLGKNRSARWLPTWNVSGGWNMHEEAFFEKLRSVMTHASFRASYSLTADAGPESVTNSTVIIGAGTPWRPKASDREPALTIVQPGNSGLTYEKKHELNIGGDFGFIENRLNLSIDAYWRNNFDLIGVTNTQGVSGQILRYANIADMKSNGIDFTISSKNVIRPTFQWTTDFTFAWTKNKITDLQPNARVMDLVRGSRLQNLEGYPVGSLFSIPFAGLDDNGLPTYWVGDQLVSQGNYELVNFQESQNVDWLKYEGTTDPKFTGGLGNTFAYKNWRLNLFMTYNFGNKIRLNPIFSTRYSDLDATPREFKNRWMMAGDEALTDIPVIVDARTYRTNYLSRAYNAYNYSSARVADGSFVRMKEISLSYDFPKEMIRGWKLNSLSLKLQATNPFLIYADKKLYGQDPEYYQSGGVSSPLAKQFTLTIRAGF